MKLLLVLQHQLDYEHDVSVMYAKIVIQQLEKRLVQCIPESL